MFAKQSVYLFVFLLLAYCVALTTVCPVGVSAQTYFKTTEGVVNFTSDAPLETIKARSGDLKAILNAANNTFAFSVSMKSFQGFNSALQREHFNDNYLESDRYPNAVFKGKIIEKVNLSRNGTYNVRAKGRLIVHGRQQERIIPARISVRNGRVEITANFNVPLSDHDIKIPKIVFQKIAENIQVNVNATLLR